MAMEITNNYSAYMAENVADSSTVNGTKKKQMQTVPVTGNSGNSQRMSDYLNELAQLAPSVEVRAGITFSKAGSGKTLTISPGLLKRMQNDPEKEKEMKELIKGVEFITKFIDGLYKSSGKTLVYRHSFIDGNGKYYACSYVKNERSNKMSMKLRKARWNNSQKLVAKTKENAAKRKKELQKTLREKRVKKTDKNANSSKTAQFLEEKIAASKEGVVYLYDTDLRTLMESAREDRTGENDNKQQAEAGANLDLRA